MSVHESEHPGEPERLYGIDEADPKMIWLADRALIAAMLGRHDDAHRLAAQLSERFGGAGLWLAMLLWTDTTLSAAGITPGAHDDEPIALRFLDVDTARYAEIDEVPAPIVWAGRFLAARAADDPDTGQALALALPDDPAAVSDTVLALLLACAGNLNALAAPR